MGSEWPYDRRMSERQKVQFRAYAVSPEELAEINEFLSKYQQWVDEIERYEREVEEAERQRKRIKCKRIKKLYYGRLSGEQYEVYMLKEGGGMEYEEIAKLTGNKPATLRKNYYDAVRNIERMSRERALNQDKRNGK